MPKKEISCENCRFCSKKDNGDNDCKKVRLNTVADFMGLKTCYANLTLKNKILVRICDHYVILYTEVRE